MVVVSLFPLDGLRPAAANHDNMVLPWEPGETWHVCIGYDTSTGVTSHQGEQKFSLDLVADASDISGNGCKAGATTSVGKNVRAPTDGKLAWKGATQTDIVCVDTPDGFSLKIGHIILGNNCETGEPLKVGDPICKNQILGTVNVPAPSNNHIAHIHIGLFTGSGCGKLGTGTGVTIPFDNRFEGVSLPDIGTQDQYQGTKIPRPATSAVDVFLLVDLSSSFADDLPVFKAQAPVIISALKALKPNIRFGLGKYEDYPIPPFGDLSAGDKAYERLVDLTPDTSLTFPYRDFSKYGC
jgi:hypothetical protein